MHAQIQAPCRTVRRRPSESAKASAANYRRRLAFEVAFMEAQRNAKARGCAVREVSLGAYPAALELVRALASRIAAGSAVPKSGVMVYRGYRARVSLSNFGRVFVSTTDGRPIGASGFGSVFAD
jgi:hypothetical protein